MAKQAPTTVRHVPQQPRRHSPWPDRALMVLAAVVLVAIVAGAIVLAIILLPSAPAQPAQTGVSVGSASSVDTQQTTPEVLASVAPMVVDHMVVWTEVTGFDPSTIPVEKRFYNGAFPQPKSVRLGPNGPDPVLEGDAYVWKILPELKGVWGINVAASRDRVDKDVVLISIVADRNFPSILLSVDGEKSWCKLTLLPTNFWEGRSTGFATEVRVRLAGDEIRLYARYPLGAGPDHLYWWIATVKKSELPCS